MLVMTDQEARRRATDQSLAALPWAQTMGKNLTAAQITAVAKRVGLSMKAAGVEQLTSPPVARRPMDVLEEPGATKPRRLSLVQWSARHRGA